MNKNNMRKALVTALCAFLLCASAGIVKAYSNSKYNFSIDPPSGWAMDESTSSAAVIFYGPAAGVSINIQCETVPPGTTIAQYVIEGKEQLQSMNAFIISEKSTTVNGVEAYEWTLNCTFGSINVREKQIFLIGNNRAYVLTYGALPTTYNDYLAAFESSAETFEILDTTPRLLGLEWWIWTVIIGVIAAVAVVTVTVVMVRRKKPQSTQPSESPPSPPS